MDKDYLVLKRASASRPSGNWSDDDYDVLADGVVVGRIMKARGAPVGSPWFWRLAYGYHRDRNPTHGYADTRNLSKSQRTSHSTDQHFKPGIWHEWISRKPQFTLFHDSIVWLAIAFDAVLKFAIAFWQLCQNLIRTTRSIRQSNRCAETDHLSDAKAVDDGGTMVSCSHNRICFLTFQDTLPTGSRAASQCRVPVAVSCIRSSILIRGCAIQNSAAIASSNIEAVSKESAISSPQSLFSGLPSL